MNNELYSIIIVVMIAAVSFLLRVAPFLFFGKPGKETPKIITYLGTVLPPAAVGMLVVFCLQDTNFEALENWLPATVAIAGLTVVQLTFKKSLASIITGLGIYLILVNLL